MLMDNLYIFQIFSDKINRNKYECDYSIYNTVEKLHNYLTKADFFYNETNKNNFSPIYFNCGKILKPNAIIDNLDKPIICYLIHNKTLSLDTSFFSSILSMLDFSINSEQLPLDPITNILNTVINPQNILNIEDNGINITPSIYSEQIIVMQNMGFTEIGRIEECLFISNGDVENAINLYLNNN